MTMEPLLSPSKSVKPKVKAARFQVNYKKMEVTDPQPLLQVASVGAGDAGEGEAAGAGNDENGWTHQGSQRCLNDLIFLRNLHATFSGPMGQETRCSSPSTPSPSAITSPGSYCTSPGSFA